MPFEVLTVGVSTGMGCWSGSVNPLAKIDCVFHSFLEGTPNVLISILQVLTSSFTCLVKAPEERPMCTCAGLHP